MKNMAKRIKRLEMHLGDRSIQELTDRELLFNAARMTCGMDGEALERILKNLADGGEPSSLSDQEQLALAIASGEKEAIDAHLTIRTDVIIGKFTRPADAFPIVHSEWKRKRAMQKAESRPVGQRFDWPYAGAA